MLNSPLQLPAGSSGNLSHELLAGSGAAAAQRIARLDARQREDAERVMLLKAGTALQSMARQCLGVAVVTSWA